MPTRQQQKIKTKKNTKMEQPCLTRIKTLYSTATAVTSVTTGAIPESNKLFELALELGLQINVLAMLEANRDQANPGVLDLARLQPIDLLLAISDPHLGCLGHNYREVYV